MVLPPVIVRRAAPRPIPVERLARVQIDLASVAQRRCEHVVAVRDRAIPEPPLLREPERLDHRRQRRRKSGAAARAHRRGGVLGHHQREREHRQRVDYRELPRPTRPDSRRARGSRASPRTARAGTAPTRAPSPRASVRGASSCRRRARACRPPRSAIAIRSAVGAPGQKRHHDRERFDRERRGGGDRTAGPGTGAASAPSRSRRPRPRTRARIAVSASQSVACAA